MTIRFGNHRLVGFIVIFLLSGTVLGLAANLASIFLPHIHHDFLIFSLIVPSLTIFLFLLLVQWAQPRIEVPTMVILAILWLAMGAWSADVIGYVQCDSIGGQTTPSHSGTTSLRSYCYQMKVIEAFSWMIFVLLVFFVVILFVLVNRALQFGRHDIWEEPIRELPWFGELPGYYNNHGGQPVQGYAPYGMPIPMQQYNGANGQPTYVQPMPGQSIVIQPGVNGQPPTITHVPGTVSSI